MDQVERFEAEIDDEDIEEVARDGIHAAHIDGLFAEPRQQHVEQHDGGDAGDHGGEDEYDRHEGGRPPGVRLDRAEDEADIAVQQEGRGDAHNRQDVADLMIQLDRRVGHVGHPDREKTI